MEKNNKEKLEQMARSRQQGKSVEEVIRDVLGGDIGGHTEEIRETVRGITSEADRLEEKYAGIHVCMAVLQEIDEQCGEDCAAQFRRISDLKYIAGLRNLKVSAEEVAGQGMDTEFVKEMLAKTHATEQQMAAGATRQQVEALRNELTFTFPTEKEGIAQMMAQAAADESWTPVLEKAKEAMDCLSDKDREDMMVMAAALFLSEHPEISAKAAAATAVVQVAQSEGKRNMDFIWMAIPTALAVMVAGLLLMFIAAVTGFSLPFHLGTMTVVVSGTILSVMALLAVGEAAYEAVKAAIPYMKKAWEKCGPYRKKAADKVKAAVACVVGVIADKVFRPVIYWVSNHAAPVIDEKIFHPLKDRLERMLEWLKEKKEQVVQFIKNAAAPKSEEESEAEEKAQEEDFACTQEEDEDEWIVENAEWE